MVLTSMIASLIMIWLVLSLVSKVQYLHCKLETDTLFYLGRCLKWRAVFCVKILSAVKSFVDTAFYLGICRYSFFILDWIDLKLKLKRWNLF